MVIQVISDIHTEFHPDRGDRAIFRLLDPSGVDVLVLAGDVGTSLTIAFALKRFCALYAQAKVVYVMGNHEFYGSSPSAAIDEVRQVEADTKNLIVLEDQIVDIDGVTFAGATMWFRNDPLNFAYKQGMSDFTAIRDFVPWVYAKNKASEVFISNALASGTVDVMVTHYLPSNQCVAPQYRGSNLNRFFVSPIADECPVEHLPPVWIYGHTHTAQDMTADGCRFVCNPMGYPSESNRSDFSFRKLIEGQSRAR